MRVLLLGGTGEARALAAALVERRVEVTSSLAGRVTNPRLPVGHVRIGGFGGVDGLVGHLRTHAVTHLVDATHPFAAAISANAARAAAVTGVPLVALRRPGWTARAGDDWTRVPTIEAAAAHVAASPPGTVLLTTGRRDLAVFAADAGHHYVARMVDPPAGRTPPRFTPVLDRGPYDLAGELALLRRHHARLLVTKDSGGTLTVAKLDAARELHVPVLMVDRPPLPDGVRACDSVEAVLAQLLG